LSQKDFGQKIRFFRNLLHNIHNPLQMADIFAPVGAMVQQPESLPTPAKPI
jgi:hypothetical protein